MTSDRPEVIETPEGVTFREHGLGRGTVIRVEATGLDEWVVDTGHDDGPAQLSLSHGLAWIGVPAAGQAVAVRRESCIVRTAEGRLVVEAGTTGETVVLVVSGSADIDGPGGETALAPATAVVLDQAGELASIDTVAVEEMAEDSWVAANTDRDATLAASDPGGDEVVEVVPGDEVVPADDPAEVGEDAVAALVDHGGLPVETLEEGTVEEGHGPAGTDVAEGALGDDVAAAGTAAAPGAEEGADDGDLATVEATEDEVDLAVDAGFEDDDEPHHPAPDLAVDGAVEDDEAQTLIDDELLVQDELLTEDEEGGHLGIGSEEPEPPAGTDSSSSGTGRWAESVVLSGRDPLPDRRGESRAPRPVPHSDFVGVADDEGDQYTSPAVRPADGGGWKPSGRLLAWLVLALVVALLLAGAIVLSGRDEGSEGPARLAEATSVTAPAGSTTTGAPSTGGPTTTTKPTTTETTGAPTSTAPPAPTAQLVECQRRGDVVVASGIVTGASPPDAAYRVQVAIAASDGRSFGEATAEAPVQPQGRASLWTTEVPLSADINGTDAGCEIGAVTTAG